MLPSEYTVNRQLRKHFGVPIRAKKYDSNFITFTVVAPDSMIQGFMDKFNYSGGWSQKSGPTEVILAV